MRFQCRYLSLPLHALDRFEVGSTSLCLRRAGQSAHRFGTHGQQHSSLTAMALHANALTLIDGLPGGPSIIEKGF